MAEFSEATGLLGINIDGPDLPFVPQIGEFDGLRSGAVEAELVIPYLQRLRPMFSGIELDLPEASVESTNALLEIENFFARNPENAQRMDAFLITNAMMSIIDEEAREGYEASMRKRHRLASFFLGAGAIILTTAARANIDEVGSVDGLVGSSLRSTFGFISQFLKIPRYTAQSPFSDWRKSMDKSAQNLANMADQISKGRPLGIANLLIGHATSARMVTHAELPESTRAAAGLYLFGPTEEVADASTRQPKAAKPIIEVVTPVCSDPEALAVVAEIGLQPLSAKQLKSHPLGTVLKNGARFRASEVYEFDGFGNSAGIAAALLEKLAGLTDDAAEEGLLNMARQVAVMKALIKNGRCSFDLQHNLASVVHVIEASCSRSFVMVVRNAISPSPQVAQKAAPRLSRLGELLAS